MPATVPPRFPVLISPARQDSSFLNHRAKPAHGSRYFAKGNYHVPRIEYLVHLFPDARFIVPVRHPLTHVHSLVRQYQLSSSYAAADARVPRYLEAAGHFEFGPQRIPIRLSAVQGDRILEAWAHGDEYLEEQRR